MIIEKLIEPIHNYISQLHKINSDKKNIDGILMDYQILLYHIKYDAPLNMEKFHKVLKANNKEADELIAKWS